MYQLVPIHLRFQHGPLKPESFFCAFIFCMPGNVNSGQMESGKSYKRSNIGSLAVLEEWMLAKLSLIMGNDPHLSPWHLSDQWRTFNHFTKLCQRAHQVLSLPAMSQPYSVSSTAESAALVSASWAHVQNYFVCTTHSTACTLTPLWTCSFYDQFLLVICKMLLLTQVEDNYPYPTLCIDKLISVSVNPILISESR